MSFASKLVYRAVENSKNTGGESGNNPDGGSGQLTLAQKQEMLALAVQCGATHFQNHLFMDTDAQMQANYSEYAANYNRLTLEQETQEWADVVHAAGLKNIYRGSWSGIKNNNGFPYATYGGAHFIPLGTVAGAASEGETTYCGKIWRFMNVNVGASRWQDGDIMAPISECTEFLSNSSKRWFDNSAGDQTAMQNFFMTLKDVVDAYGASIGKSIGFFTIVNYSEYRSGYLGQTLPNDQGIIAIDYYGHYNASNGTNDEPSNYVADWIAVRNATFSGKPLYQTEMGGIWGDSWPSRVSNYEDSVKFQMDFYKAYRDSLIDPGLMTGMSNWGFWSGQNSSILRYSGGHYYLNSYGQIWANFMRGNGMGRIPVPNSTIWDSFGNRSNYF